MPDSLLPPSSSSTILPVMALSWALVRPRPPGPWEALRPPAPARLR